VYDFSQEKEIHRIRFWLYFCVVRAFRGRIRLLFLSLFRAFPSEMHWFYFVVRTVWFFLFLTLQYLPVPHGKTGCLSQRQRHEHHPAVYDFSQEKEIHRIRFWLYFCVVRAFRGRIRLLFLSLFRVISCVSW
jgi:hypothetical protein